MKPIQASLAFALAGFLLGTAPEAAAFPATKDTAEATLTFNLLPVAGSGTAIGTVVVDVTRTNGVSTSSPLVVTLSGLTDGTYTLAANLKSDGGLAPVSIGLVAVPAVPAPALTLPANVDPFDIAAITVSDATLAVVLSGTATEEITLWNFKANIPLTSPVTPAAAPPVGHGPKPKKLKGHVVVQARIVENVEQRRKFLLVAQGAAPNATFTINLDGVAVGSVVATKSGKLMLKSLDGDFRLAGVQLLTIKDAGGIVIGEADFFPTAQ